jgi:Protein of unknown function (DUF3775)
MELTKQKIEQAIALSQAFGRFISPGKDTPWVISVQEMPGKLEMHAIEASEEFQALKAFFHCLSDIELRELQALMFIGRGDYPAIEFRQVFDAIGLNENREDEKNYMIHKISAADYLAEGFEKLNRARMI